MSPEEIELFKNWQAPLPAREAHGTDEDIRSQLKSVNPTNWRLEGNKLIADTQHGELGQYIPSNLILTGVDQEGLPVFKKV